MQNTTVNQTIIADGDRDFSWLWMIVFIILVWPAAIIYYFVAKESGGCTVNIQSLGRKSEVVFVSLSSAIR